MDRKEARITRISRYMGSIIKELYAVELTQAFNFKDCGFDPSNMDVTKGGTKVARPLSLLFSW